MDKEDHDSAIVVTLERNKYNVLKGNWHEALEPRIRDDLRKHRSYNGKSVRDLLRAMRNKKHHYNELSEDIKMTFGRIPDGYINYWTSRFPKLVTHSWYAMHCVKNESTFQKYFDKEYDFIQVRIHRMHQIVQSYWQHATFVSLVRHSVMGLSCVIKLFLTILPHVLLLLVGDVINIRSSRARCMIGQIWCVLSPLNMSSLIYFIIIKPLDMTCSKVSQTNSMEMVSYFTVPM